MPIEIITAKDITVRYNSIDVLSHLNFTVLKGDYIGLVGTNGSGKSTLVRTILGFIKPISGSMRVFGHISSEFRNWDKIGYLPQKMATYNPNFPTSVEEIVALGLLSKKTFPKRITKKDKVLIDRALELLDIIDLKKELFGNLSQGQQQRVLAARAIVHEPELLILDEPTTAFDPEIRESFFSLMQDFNKNKGATIILVTHDIGSIGKYASKLLYLDKRIIFYGSFDEFCKSDKMSQFFGASSQHIICHKHD
ncbi:MAG: metal ABC transporter ATP-binding protein [Thermodesulfovibrionales bacterium]|nr:metal ABC transporter ATP-binding protein [Thermodesulfovibrionales bacterium]